MISSGTDLNPRIQNAFACALIVVSGVYVFRWIFDPGMTFYVDDWSWLYRSRFEEWTQWTIFPKQVYNDRPIGALIINALYHLFGLNYPAYGAVLLSIHILNGLLLFAVASRILKSTFYGAIVGLIFVVNLNIAYQTWWTGTLFDSTSLFFCLCSFLMHLSKASYAKVLTILFYFLAVRSKEASLPFPFILFAYSVLSNLSSLKLTEIRRCVLRALGLTWPIFLVFAVMLGIFFKYYLAVKSADFGPYAPRFSIMTMVDGAKIYLRYISFDLLSQESALVAYAAIIAIAVVIWAPMAILGGVGFLIAAAPVLVLATQRVPYYGYIPSPYVVLLVVGVVQRLNGLIAVRSGEILDRVFKLVALGAVVWFVSYIPRLELYRESLLVIMRENSLAMKTMRAALDHVDDKSKVVITGLPPGPLNLFAHAPCHAIMVIYEVKTLDCRIDGQEADLLKEYKNSTGHKILLRYDKGMVTLVERSS